MDREFEYQTDVTKIHHTNYVRNSRAITVVWAIFTICFAILNIVAFIQPQWLGDTMESPGVGHIGLIEICERIQAGSDYTCRGDFFDYNTILNDSFRAASFLVGLSALLFCVTCVCLLLFCFLKAATVLMTCGWIQLLAGVSIAVGCIVFPNGWNDTDVRNICGQDTDSYKMGRCSIRWAFILAIVLIFDALILAALAFVLAKRQANLLPESAANAKTQSGMINGGFIVERVESQTIEDDSPRDDTRAAERFSDDGSNRSLKGSPDQSQDFKL